MGRLVRFPSHLLTIELPLDALPDDEFEFVVISDDSLNRGTIYKGDIVIIKLGLYQAGGLHAVITPTGQKYVGFLVDKGNGLISIETNNDEYEPDIYPRDKIKILGRVVQVIPGGDVREWWELRRASHLVKRRPSNKLAEAK